MPQSIIDALARGITLSIFFFALGGIDIRGVDLHSATHTFSDALQSMIGLIRMEVEG